MEHAGVSLEAGLQDQLDQFDFDEFIPDLGTGAFDFGLEGSAEQGEHSLAEDVADDAGAPPLDPDLDQEAHSASIAKQAQITVAAEDAGNAGEAATETGVEYQDEIGYEDDDLVNIGTNGDLSITEIGEAESGLLTALPDDHQHLESARPAGGDLTELLTHDKDASWDEDINFEEHSEPVNPQHESGSVGEEEAAEHLEHNDVIVADFHDESAHELLAADHYDNDLDKALDDLSHSLSDAPDIEVLYNEECYSLFGTSDDDPESYFLSDVQELDRPLSHFLTALRAVISDDLAPTDVVVLRFEPFDLEFGQRSDATFLNHTFREILDCHTALSRVPGISADPVIHLMVRRDNEEHFLELLARAELVKDSTYDTEDSEMSENADEESGADGLDDGQMQDEPYEGGESDEFVEEAGHAPTAHGEDANEPEPDMTPIQGDTARESEQDLEAGLNAPQSPSVAADALGNGETHPYEAAEDGAGDEQVWDEQAVEDAAGEEQAQDEQAAEDDEAGSQHRELLLETFDEQSHQPIRQQDGNESTKTADLSSVDESAAPENGGQEQETGSIDDDLILAFDDDHDLPAIHEEGDEHEDDLVTYDASENIPDHAEGASVAGGTAPESFREDPENDVHAVAAAESESVHTSTTLNGDEIDYDEENDAAEAFNFNDGAPQSTTASGADDDEIDWENDEDGDEQQPPSGDEGAEYEESKEAALTPSSVTGKRSRTDEAESLADETDYKRRRT